MSETFEIRRIRPEDLDEVMEIERTGFQHPWSRELLRRELDHDWSTILVCLSSGENQPGSIVGFLIYWLVHDEIHILNVATALTRRRSGIARRLMAETERRAHELGASLVTLEVRRSNTAALELYRAFEFRAVGVRPNYYADEGEDAIVMTKELVRGQP